MAVRLPKARPRRSRSFARRGPTVARGYRRILVPVAGNLESERALDVACRLASERHAVIEAVVVIEVPTLLPLDAHMLDEEEDALGQLERARGIGATYGVNVSVRVERARDAASAIVERAKASHPELIVIGGARKRRRSSRSAIFGTTIQDVLHKAPCRVMVIAAGPCASSSAGAADDNTRRV